MSLTKEEAIQRARERVVKKNSKQPLSNNFPVSLGSKTPLMDAFNDVTGGIQSMANPGLRLLARAEKGLTGTNYFGGILSENQASQDRGANLRLPREMNVSPGEGISYTNLPGWMEKGNIDVGDIAGEVAGGIALTKGQGVAPTLGGRLSQAGITGATLGPAFSPMEEDTLSAMNTGSKYGLLTTPAMETARFIAQKAIPTLEKVFSSSKTRAARMISDLLGDEKAHVKNALQNTKSRVPGENLTAGEAAVPAGSSKMSVLQKMAEEVEPEKYRNINNANKQARINAIRSAGGDVKSLEAARDAVALPMKDKALQLADQSGKLNVKTIIPIIDAEISNKMIPTVQRKALYAIRDNILSRANPETGKIDADALYTVRKEIGNNLEEIFSSSGLRWDKAMSGRVQGKLQTIIDDAIEGSGGTGWKDYLKTYREMSIPIENAKLGNEYAKRLENPLKTERPASFSNYVSTKRPNNQKLAVETDAVMESLQRRKDLNEMAVHGVTGTREAMNVPGLPNTGMFSPSYQVTKSILNRFSDRATKGVMQEIANSFDDPQKVLGLLQQTTLPGEVQRTIYALSQQQAAATAGLLGVRNGVHPH